MFGRLLGDPRRRAADLFLSLQDVLPNAYPLMQASIETVLADENYLGRIIDYGIIAPRVPQLYRAAADDLNEPRITELCTDEYPVYAWPYAGAAAGRAEAGARPARRDRGRGRPSLSQQLAVLRRAGHGHLHPRRARSCIYALARRTWPTCWRPARRILAAVLTGRNELLAELRAEAQDR